VAFGPKSHIPKIPFIRPYLLRQFKACSLLCNLDTALHFSKPRIRWQILGGAEKEMRFLLLSLIFIIPVSLLAQERSVSADPCLEKASSQAELNTCASDAFSKADAELNQVYQQLLKKYAGDNALLRRLRLAQQAWLRFRDADVNALYPEPQTGQGSVNPMCRAMEMARLTIERTEELKRLLNPREGDVCPF
jgi:uncharacterized protein YecT (DUF1311 family)